MVAFTAKIASGLDNLYWASQRTGATVRNSVYWLCGFAGWRQRGRCAIFSGRPLPGLFVTIPVRRLSESLGVQTRDASGNVRDMAAIFYGRWTKLGSMPYYRANQYAQMLGIDENTLMAMRRGRGQFSAQYSEMVKAIEFNADQAALSSNRFMTSLKSLGEMARDGAGQNRIESCGRTGGGRLITCAKR